jgi:hypothetical protein
VEIKEKREEEYCVQSCSQRKVESNFRCYGDSGIEVGYNACHYNRIRRPLLNQQMNVKWVFIT